MTSQSRKPKKMLDCGRLHEQRTSWCLSAKFDIVIKQDAWIIIRSYLCLRFMCSKKNAKILFDKDCQKTKILPSNGLALNTNDES